ncbi:MAG: hypothetical protein ACK5PG_07825 [Lysobacterales bacterium]|jgi:hypothetical protein
MAQNADAVDPEHFRALLGLLDDVAKNEACFRAFALSREDRRGLHQCWSQISDALALATVNSWCMVFGAWGSNPTHWTNVLVSQHANTLSKRRKRRMTDSARRSFRAHLAESINLDEEAWTTFHREMCDFRNNYSAHRAIKAIHPLPDLAIAVRIAFELDEWLRHWAQTQRLDYPLLKTDAQPYAQAVRAELGQAFEALRTRRQGSL